MAICELWYLMEWATLSVRTHVHATQLFIDSMEALPRYCDLSIVFRCHGDPAAAMRPFRFSIPLELDYERRFAELQLLGLPRRAAHRDEGQPILFGRGHVFSAITECCTSFFDEWLAGDGEDTLPMQHTVGESACPVASNPASIDGI